MLVQTRMEVDFVVRDPIRDPARCLISVSVAISDSIEHEAVELCAAFGRQIGHRINAAVRLRVHQVVIALSVSSVARAQSLTPPSRVAAQHRSVGRSPRKRPSRRKSVVPSTSIRSLPSPALDDRNCVKTKLIVTASIPSSGSSSSGPRATDSHSAPSETSDVVAPPRAGRCSG